MNEYRLRCGSRLCTHESCGCEWGCGDIRDAHAAGRAERDAEVRVMVQAQYDALPIWELPKATVVLNELLAKLPTPEAER